jgi:hypothetical protein
MGYPFVAGQLRSLLQFHGRYVSGRKVDAMSTSMMMVTTTNATPTPMTGKGWYSPTIAPSGPRGAALVVDSSGTLKLR